jgi:UDP-N-acetylmuramoylalanine-D-glutamate ligase
MIGKCSTIFLQLDSPKQMTLNFKAFIPMQQTHIDSHGNAEDYLESSAADFGQGLYDF